jgi:endonuclease/exonuclease/phosphatase family metal-dependent hydrolase
MSAFANNALLTSSMRQMINGGGLLAARSNNVYGAHVVCSLDARRCKATKTKQQHPTPPLRLHMSTTTATILPQPPPQPITQSFALPPDNFSRYSKFLVKRSNVVDGLGGNSVVGANKNFDTENLLPWVDTLIAKSLPCKVFEEGEAHGSTNEPSSPLRHEPFSILSWNILAQSLYESHHRTKRIKQVALSSSSTMIPYQSPPPNTWSNRLYRIIQTLTHANSDIICLQECELHSFISDIVPALYQLGYDGLSQEDNRIDKPAIVKEMSKHRDPRNHICATFWKREKFMLWGDEVGCRTRSLTTVLRLREDDDEFSSSNNKRKKERKETEVMPTVAVVNCHLEGHPQRFLERTSQLQHALSDLSKRIQNEASSSSLGDGNGGLNALILAGDFNCELQSSACSTYLRMGRLGRQAGLGGIHGEDSLVLPPSLLETSEAAEILHPIIEWGRALPDDKVGEMSPHPFRRNGMTSAYPTWLGKDDATQHFTYCGENRRPVPGLDQIWYSSMTIERVGLKRMFADVGREWRCISDENILAQLRDNEKRKVLSTGLPTPDGKYPSDHLPIGAVFDWKMNRAEASDGVNGSTDDGIRRLQIVDEEGNNVEDAMPQDDPTALEAQQSFDTPIQELEFLIQRCPFDSKKQRSDVQFLLSPIEPPIDLTTRAKPTPGQLAQLAVKREKKAELLKSASLGIRPWLKKIWKVEKQVGKWERRQAMFTRK